MYSNIWLYLNKSRTCRSLSVVIWQNIFPCAPAFTKRLSCICDTNHFLPNQPNMGDLPTLVIGSILDSCSYLLFITHTCPVLVLSGGPCDQGQDDGVRHNHGQLPATGGQGELLPHGHLKPSCHLRRHRLPHWGDRTARPWPLRNPSDARGECQAESSDTCLLQWMKCLSVNVPALRFFNLSPLASPRDSYI